MSTNTKEYRLAWRNGQTFIVAVGTDRKLMMHDIINACRAAAAHIVNALGGDLPADARLPEPGEFDITEKPQ